MPTTMRIFLYRAVPNAVISERINDICGINPNAKNKKQKMEALKYNSQWHTSYIHHMFYKD